MDFRKIGEVVVEVVGLVVVVDVVELVVELISSEFVEVCPTLKKPSAINISFPREQYARRVWEKIYVC